MIARRIWVDRFYRASFAAIFGIFFACQDLCYCTVIMAGKSCNANRGASVTLAFIAGLVRVHVDEPPRAVSEIYTTRCEIHSFVITRRRWNCNEENITPAWGNHIRNHIRTLVPRYRELPFSSIKLIRRLIDIVMRVF